MADKYNNPATLTETGRRKNNEDTVLGQASTNGASGPRVIIAVADGMGGLEAGEMASKNVHDMLYNLHQGGLSGDYNHIYGRIKDCIRTANHNIYEWSQKKAGIQMGTTVSGAVIIGNRYLVFNVGDSRTYLIRKDGIKQVTTDHSVDTEAFQAGLIKKDEIGKGAYSNALTRTVGTDPHVDVDIFPYGHFSELNKGDILFCCTDGLWGRVKDDDIRREIMARSDLNKSLEFLYRLAYKNGSKDNISMAAYRYGDFTGVPLKQEKPGKKEKQVTEKKQQGKRKIKISLPLIVAVLFIGFLIIVISLLSNYMSTPKKDTKVGQEQIVKNTTSGTPLTSDKILNPTSKTESTTTNGITPTHVSREERKQLAPNNHSQDVRLTTVQPTTTPTLSPTTAMVANNDTKRGTGTTPAVQPITQNTVEISLVSLSQLPKDIRDNIKKNFLDIKVPIEGIMSINEKSSNSELILELDLSGTVKSIEIPEIEVKPKEKEAEFKSKLIQRMQDIRKKNFPIPIINGKAVNVKIRISLKGIGIVGKNVIITL